jgi:hypothetical protein
MARPKHGVRVLLKDAVVWILTRGIWFTWRLERTPEGTRHRIEAGMLAFDDEAAEMLPLVLGRSRRGREEHVFDSDAE